MIRKPFIALTSVYFIFSLGTKISFCPGFIRVVLTYRVASVVLNDLLSNPILKDSKCGVINGMISWARMVPLPQSPPALTNVSLNLASLKVYDMCTGSLNLEFLE